MDVPPAAFVRTYTSDALASASDSDATGFAGCGGATGGAGAGVVAEAAICCRYASSAGSAKGTFFSECALFGPALRGLATAGALCAVPDPRGRDVLLMS